MLRLVKISYFSYFFLFMLLWAFVCVYNVSGEEFMHVNILLIFTVLLLPVFDKIYDIFAESVQSYQPHSVWEILGDIWVPIVLLWSFAFGYIGFGFLLWVWALWVVYKNWDTRIFFCISLWMFLYIALYLLFWQNTQAEELSLSAYYVLIVAVVVQLLQSFRNSRNKKI